MTNYVKIRIRYKREFCIFAGNENRLHDTADFENEIKQNMSSIGTGVS